MKTRERQEGWSILVVDDEKGVRELIQDFLTKEGYSVTTAEDGIDALEKLQKDFYDLLITDLVMPHMDGLELLDRVWKKRPELISLIITGSLTDDIAEYATHRGVFACIPKPFQLNYLSQMVRRGLDQNLS